MKKKIIIFFILVAIVFRFVFLGITPAHLSNDEIGAAYDAYSISKTLRDEHNEFLPITFKSHGVYRSALAVYLLVPTIKLFGNNDVSARLPSAFFGGLTIILFGALVYELSRKYMLALISSLVLAYSPLHIFYSRLAVESNIALFFVVLGIYLFFISLLRNKSWALIFSFVSFALSFYGYYTEWGMTPLIMLSLFIIYRKSLLKRKSYWIGGVLFVTLLSPLVFDFIKKASMSRASTEFFIYEPEIWGYLTNGYHSILQKILFLTTAAFDKYSGYLNLKYIFFNGTPLLPKESPYQVGFFYAPLIVFFFLGILKIKHYFQEHSTFIFSLFFITPLIPALSRGELNSLRALPVVIPYSIIIACGVVYFFNHLKNKLSRLAMVVLVLISAFYFFIIYMFLFPREQAQGYQYGFEQSAEYLKSNGERFKKIIIDPRFGDKEFYFSGVPHVYIPFYLNMDPTKLQNAWKVREGIGFDKYEFRNIDWESEEIQDGILYIVPHDNLPDFEATRLKEINAVFLPNYKVQFRFFSR